MDSSNGYRMQGSWSAAQLEQLRKFLQPASQIPSSTSIQEVLQAQYQLSSPNHSPRIAGTSVGHIPSTENEPNILGYKPGAQVLGVTRALASSVPNSLVLPVPDGVTAIKYPVPNVNMMVFDPGTGYRFDQITGLHYDANAGLFFNKRLNLLLKWNPMTSTYSLVGRASDVAAPTLAPSSNVPTLNQHVPSSPVRDATLKRKRSLSFEEMSPGRDEVVYHQRASPSSKQPSGVSRHDVAAHALAPSSNAPTSNQHIPSSPVRDATFKRERSLSFEEMSPDRDEVVFHQRASPSSKQPSGVSRHDVAGVPERRRSLSFEEMTPERDSDDSSSVPIFPRDSRSPSCDRRRGSPDRYSDRGRRHAPDGGLGRASPRRAYSKSPSPRPTCRRRSPNFSRYRQTDRSWRRSSPKRQYSPRRGSQRSPIPERRTSRTSDPGRAPRRQLNTVITREAKGSRDGRRFCRSPSSARFEGRQKADYSERGRSSKRSRSRCTENRCSRKRSPSHSSTKDDSDPPPSCSQYDTTSDGSRQVKDAANPETASDSQRGFSDTFIAKNIDRIHKKNLRNPANTYGRIFPTHSVLTLFIALTPLPQLGDRIWDDLEALFRSNLKGQGVTYQSVAIYPGDGGAPCNYCLVRFKHVEEAFRWYITHEGTFELSNPDGSTCTVFMHFLHNNWKCRNCKEINFALRHFCHKCFWYTNQSRKPPIVKSQLVTQYVGISGLDCRFLSVEEVLVGLPPLVDFNVETLELLTEVTGVPLGLVVFKFKEPHESAAFFQFLQENSLNPFFVNIVERSGLAVNPILGSLLKGYASSALTNPVVPAPIVQAPTSPVVFPNPPQLEPETNPSLWWRFVVGYTPDSDLMKYLFEEHEQVNIKYESANSQILMGPLPLPVAFDVMEYRDVLGRFLVSTGVSAKNSEKAAICKAHNFGAPYDYSLLPFDRKTQGKEWLEQHNGKLVLHLENGSTWKTYLHYAKPNWICQCCKKLNFPIRIQCFSCYKARLSDHTSVTIKKNPTNCIGITGFQNWCATEDLLFKKLGFLREMKNLTISYLKEPTGVPLGICALKSSTPAASEVLFNKLQDALVHEMAKASIQEPSRPLLTYIM